MTTDIINNRDTEKALMTSSALFRSILNRTRSSGKAGAGTLSPRPASALADMAGDAAEVFDSERDGAGRLVSNTIALLEYANRLIEAAEQHIAEQEQRIATLTTLSITDELTGLRNRRGFYEAFMAELDRCNRGQSHGGLLILIDLDNFKSINDNHGHPAGDACLKLVARAIADQVRMMDTTARLGGDEFVILLSNTSKEEAAKRAQSLAWQLNNLALAWYGEEIPVRASLGLKSFGAGDCAEKIFNAADLQLYATKTFRSRKRTQEGPEAVAGETLQSDEQHTQSKIELDSLRGSEAATPV
jgi:diguanylate cyclase (GGDEF)-like protein